MQALEMSNVNISRCQEWAGSEKCITLEQKSNSLPSHGIQCNIHKSMYSWSSHKVMAQTRREHLRGLPGDLYKRLTVAHVKITARKSLPELSLKQDTILNVYLERLSTQNQEFVDHFILEDLSEIACNK